jgi:hypothetical protein
MEVADLHHAMMANRRSEGAGKTERIGPARLDSHFDVSRIIKTCKSPSESLMVLNRLYSVNVLNGAKRLKGRILDFGPMTF